MPVHVDRSRYLPESEYFPDPQEKSGIALHHTVCDSARTTLDIWRTDSATDGTPRRVATAYLIDPDGTVYEAFDPACWAWQFGLRWPDELRIPFEQRFIGIEITSEGGLTEYDGRLYAYGRINRMFETPREQAFECPTDYRGYHWFDRYEPQQLEALGHLVDDLCERFAIPRVYPEKPFLYYGDALAPFEGVIGHAMVRTRATRRPIPSCGARWRRPRASSQSRSQHSSRSKRLSPCSSAMRGGWIAWTSRPGVSSRTSSWSWNGVTRTSS
jgi:hypothetical protein